MQLLKLSLENWRGVVARSVELSAGVTLIEGPNEIGKSTVVEAIRTLFSEMDSSNKKHVKAIQPVGQDVGSSVEAEIKSGDYHFVYAKTYNKSKQTTLDILAPSKKQLTGREAHESVEQMLGETVDMALWDALLVDQGEKVALANIQDSAGLANALDEAAGSASDGVEDTGMYSSVQAEYEKYYTLKTGQAKFGGVETKLEKASVALEDARNALAEVETDSAEHERSAAEVRRLKTELPGLKAKTEAYEKSWNSVQSLQQKVDAKAKELESAELLHKAALDLNAGRRELVDEIQASRAGLDEATDELGPSKQHAERLKEQAGSAQLVIKDLKKKAKNVRAQLELAQEDERYAVNLESLGKEKHRSEQLDGTAKDMKSYLDIEGSVSITDDGLEDIREAESTVVLARSRRDTAATTISVTAEKELAVEVDGEKISLDTGGVETRAIASEMQVRLPGVASIQVSPSHSVADLQEKVEEAEADLATLLDRYGVKNLKDAVTANQKREEAQREIDRFKIRETEILQGDNKAEIVQLVSSLQKDCDSYVAGRKSKEEIPQTVSEAARRVTGARPEVSAKESALEGAQEKSEALQEEHNEADAKLRIAEQDLAGRSAALKDRQDRLEKSRLAASDGYLATNAVQTGDKIDQFSSDYEKLKASLHESSPESVEALLTNARDVFSRGEADLGDAETNLAVLADRLQHAQADGRFEAFEAAEREFEECQSMLEATRRRAGAIELLWQTLNKHRDSSRQAYVQPLKEAIERLGAIVFGANFEVALGDDWSLESRTLNGKTLPFDNLSVGAKEQLGILTRLAAAQIVSTQGGVPLIIDDALGFSDPSRLETMGAAISAAGKQSQIIILTCTPGRFMHVGNADVVRF